MRDGQALGRSVVQEDENSDGNIWFERTEHTWVGGTEWVLTADEHGNQIEKFTNGKCKYCGASQKALDRGEGFETHAYAFIHTDDIKARIAELFGDDMQFDVIIGNPPYQLRRRRIRHERSAHLPPVRRASEEARPALPDDDHPVALVRRR